MSRRPAHEIVDVVQRLGALRLNQGTSGNLSARWQSGLLITPSGVAYEELTPAMVVSMKLDGSYKGDLAPSSEWRFHVDIMKARADVGAVLHVHSPFATTLACLGRPIPAFHYMIAIAGGNSIRCADYETFGTAALSANVLHALGDRKACLMANHGMIALGPSPQAALDLAIDVEALAEQYWRALQIGRPHLLSDAEMERVLNKFGSYGQRSDTR